MHLFLKTKYKNIKFLLTENIVNKIKTEVKGNLKNLTIEEACYSIKTINKEIIFDIYPINNIINNNNMNNKNKKL